MSTENINAQEDGNARGSEGDFDQTLKLELDDSTQLENSSSDSTKLTISVDDTEEEIRIVTTDGSTLNSASTTENAKKKSFWVSNITHNTRAADVRKAFNEIGKVQTVKILTNNNNFFAYVTMKDACLVKECIEKLNNATINGEIISVSTKKPCLKETMEKTKKKEEIKSSSADHKKENRSSKEISKEENKERSTADTEDKNSQIIASQRQEINRLKMELRAVYNNNCSLKSSLKDMERNCDTVNAKYKNLKREFEKLDTENRRKRRKLMLDQENFEHSIKLKMTEMDDLKQELNRQLDETKKFNQQLSSKQDESIKPFKTFNRPRSPSTSRLISSSRNLNSRRDQQAKQYRGYIKRTKTPPPPAMRTESSFPNAMKPPNTGLNHPTHGFQEPTIHHHSNVGQRRISTVSHEYGEFPIHQSSSGALPQRGNSKYRYYKC